jgi:hypothetical protein
LLPEPILPARGAALLKSWIFPWITDYSSIRVPVVAQDYGRYPLIAAFSALLAIITASANSVKHWKKAKSRYNHQIRLVEHNVV